MESIKQLVERRLAPPVVTAPNVDFRCVVCEDSGWEQFKDDQARLWARRCACVTSAPMHMTNCPQEFRSTRIDDLQQSPANADALARVRKWVPRGRDLYLHGRPGRGKTMLACAAVNELRKPARFELVHTLLRELVHADDESERWQAALNVPVLVLDDLGMTDSDWTRRTLSTIYSERLARARRTVFTSNLSVKELVDAWGDERLGSRIAGAADIVELEGVDYRRKRG